ncbi:MAG: hypothetical protein ACRDMV_25300 [Streptosporangiales bacterium]
MPRTLVRGAEHDRRRSLGWLALAWMEHFTVYGPGDVQGEPVKHGDEYSGFVADCYALQPVGRLLYDSAFLSRPKGCDKSGLGGRLSLFEGLGPCRFAGWAKGGETYTDPWGLGFTYVYEPGEPMGRHVTSSFIRVLATEEGQTGNVYDTVFLNLTEGPLARVPGIDAGLTRVYLPGGGEIRPSTASSSSKDGGLETFVVFDETHLYNLPELRAMYATVTRNTRKRKRGAGTWYLETTTMFAPGEESVAEATYAEAEAIKEGRKKRARLLYDHRWGECDDLSAEEQLRTAILEAFGEAIEWNDIDGIVDGFYDTRNSPADSRRYFLNAPTSTADAWLAHHELAAIADATKTVADGDTITLGFDGSRRRSKGVTDATALIGCRVSDGHLFEVAVWEQPSGPSGSDWEVPVAEVEAAVRAAFDSFRVVGFYCDPAKWETHVVGWEAAYGRRLQVKASRDHPCQWWMTGGRSTVIVRAVDRLHNAIVEQETTFDGAHALTRHLLNARRRSAPSGVLIYKEHPDSPRKIDAAIAAVLAWQARLDAVAKGLGSTRRKSRRIARY